MSNLLQVCIYNTELEAAKELLSQISALNFVRVVSEVTSPDALAVALEDSGINLCFFHLDPNPDEVVQVIDQMSTRYPELALIAISHQSNPQAILAPIRAGCDQLLGHFIERRTGWLTRTVTSQDIVQSLLAVRYRPSNSNNYK